MMNEYIVELESPFESSIEEYFINMGCNIIFFDEIQPDLVILETEQDISTLKYIKSFNAPRTGELLHINKTKHVRSVRMEPSVETGVLHNFGYGFGVKIAVLDAGINLEICPEIEEEIDFTGTGNYTESPHGSIVTGIIKSFSKAASIFSAKVCTKDDDLRETNIFKALKWAREMDVDIINMSIGLPYDCDGSCKLSMYINTLIEKCGIIVVAAAGNDWEAEGNHFYKRVHCPACATGVISVGSLSNDGLDVAQFSVPGKTNSDKPNILAPGHGKLYSEAYSSPFRGTSFAAPVVTGILGCLVSYISNMGITVGKDEVTVKKETLEKIRYKLYATAERLEDVFASRQGMGKIDLQKLLEVLENENKSNITGTAN